MRKFYNYLSLLILFTTITFGQTVTLTPTAINGNNVNSGPLNLASVPTSTISLNVKVDIPSNIVAGDQGTITIYYSNLSSSNANITSGGNGGNLFFGGGKIANRSFVINLYWSDFLTSGGFIYAEYKTPSGVAYRSSNVAVIKNSTMTSGTTLNPPADAPNPTKIINTLCCNQTIRLGDKPQLITGSQFLNPYEKEPYGINSKWETSGNPTATVESLDNSNKTLTLGYITQSGNFTIKRSLGYNYGGEYPNKSNTITITVVPSPILTNSISTTDGSSSNNDGYYELSSLKTINLNGNSSKVNLNILNDPQHVNQRGDNITDVDSYRWEYKDSKYNSNPWIIIPNENTGALDFSDPSKLSNFEDTYYLVRRIAIYKNISRVSNEFPIVVRGLRFNNTICCDQSLKISSETDFEKPTTIIGSTPIIDNSGIEGTNFTIRSTTYQWQVRNIERSKSAWIDIPNAIDTDYLPTQVLQVVKSANRGGSYGFKTSYEYRRIVKSNYEVYNNKWISGTRTSYSNETNLEGIYNEPVISMFPNPTSSILNIQSLVNLTNSEIIISNVNGNIINNNNYSIINSNLISIDVSNYIIGTYFITIQAPNLNITQKTFIKQ